MHLTVFIDRNDFPIAHLPTPVFFPWFLQEVFSLATKKSYAFAFFLLVMALIALLGVALLVYGSATWKPSDLHAVSAVISRWGAYFHA